MFLREMFAFDEVSCSPAVFSPGCSFSRLPASPLALGRGGSGDFSFLKLRVTNYSPSEVQLQVPSILSEWLFYQTQKAWRKVSIIYFKNGSNKYLLILKSHSSAQIMVLSLKKIEKFLILLHARPSRCNAHSFSGLLLFLLQIVFTSDCFHFRLVLFQTGFT